jgi:pyruvate dehydrogenase E2 component (dihydrolipoamide acetyltransferase)
MAEKVFMIALSPTMDEGKITAWKVKEGDPVKSGTVICEVETDKAVMEYESNFDGTLLKILLKQGQSAKVGDLIAVIGKPGENIDALLKAAPAPVKPAAGSAAKPVPVPAAADKADASKAAGPSAAFSAQPGTAKAVTVPAAPAEGKAGTQAGTTLPPAGAASSAPGPSGPGEVLGYGSYPKSSPLARRLAREKGLDIRAVPGSGPDGRVVKRDVLRFVQSGSAAAAPHTAGPRGAGSEAAPVQSGAAQTAPRPALKAEIIPVGGMRAAIAKRLSESFYSAPHYFLRAAVGMDALLDARTKLNAELNPKISLNAFFMKFAAEAIKRHPRINSTWKGATIEIHGTVDVGLAVALPDGLITPVVRDCGSKGIAEIDRELSVLVDKTRKGGLKPDEYSGATFTISNLGTYGIEEFTAIINPPGSAILALGEVRKEPVVTDEDEVVIKRMMRMTLSCDHRTIDGAVGAAFLRDLKLMIEDPFRALL